MGRDRGDVSPPPKNPHACWRWAGVVGQGLTGRGKVFWEWMVKSAWEEGSC